MPVETTLNARVPVKVWTDRLEPQAAQQLTNTASLPFVFRHVAAMADVHQYAPHLPLGQERTALHLTQPQVTRLAEGVIAGVHQVHSITLAPGVPDGRYTFAIADPDPASGTAWVQLLRDGVAVDGVGATYPTRFHLSPSEDPPIVYTFDFPGYFRLGIAAAPGIYRWVSLFNVYDTVFDGERFLAIGN